MNCFNGELYLKEAIQSIYDQSYKNWEIIFIDNASDDNSKHIVDLFCSKIKYFKNEKNIPLGHARNQALEKCRGDYITFLDVDDLWLEKKLELQIKYFKNFPDSILIYSDGYDMYNSNKTKNKFSSNFNVSPKQGDIFKDLININFINWQTVMINVKLSKNKLFFNNELTYAEDYDLLLKLSLIGKIRYIDKPLIYYRYHDNNMSRDRELILKEVEIVWNTYKKEIGNRNINMKKPKAKVFGSTILKLLIAGESIENYKKKLIEYPNMQNLILFILIQLRMTWVLKYVKGKIF